MECTDVSADVAGCGDLCGGVVFAEVTDVIEFVVELEVDCMFGVVLEGSQGEAV